MKLERNLLKYSSVTGPKQGRLPFLDWMRGVAAVIMLQGHTFHSFATQQARQQGPYNLSQFFGGLGPAIFLFLTGITFGFILHRGEKKGLSHFGRWKAALWRARYLFLLAFLFRFQMWAFALGSSPWTDLLKVDVLNCMGLTLLVLSPLALLSVEQRVSWGAIAGLAFAAASPIVSAVNWAWLPKPVSDYFVPSLDHFAFFPWAAFIAFGVSAGSILRMVKADDLNRLMQWSALAGFGLLLGGQYFTNIPYSIYPSSDFWLNSPGLVVIKTGLLLLVCSFAYLWSKYVIRERWSWIAQLGSTSLLVYWVHIEIVYGSWFGGWKERLGSAECAIYSVLLILAMIGLSVLRTRLKGVRLPLPEWTPSFASSALSPRRVSGD